MKLITVLALALGASVAYAVTTAAVYFGQTHVLKATDSYFGLEALIKVHVTDPATPASPAVTAALSLGGQALVLPLTGPATIRQPDDGNSQYAEFRSGPHALIAREIEGTYPNYRQVMPSEFLAEATVPATHRPSLIAWLRSLTGHRFSVRLSWESPGQLTLTCVDNEANSATIQVPVTVNDIPPGIAFEPLFLASALEIGPELRLIDGMSPWLTASPSRAFCVLMPLRCEAAAVVAARPTSQEPQQEVAPAPEAIAA